MDTHPTTCTQNAPTKESSEVSLFEQHARSVEKEKMAGGRYSHLVAKLWRQLNDVVGLYWLLSHCCRQESALRLSPAVQTTRKQLLRRRYLCNACRITDALFLSISCRNGSFSCNPLPCSVHLLSHAHSLCLSASKMTHSETKHHTLLKLI